MAPASAGADKGLAVRPGRIPICPASLRLVRTGTVAACRPAEVALDVLDLRARRLVDGPLVVDLQKRAATSSAMLPSRTGATLRSATTVIPRLRARAA